MGQHHKKDEADRHPNRTRGERYAGEGARFRGDLDRDRTDGGFLPAPPAGDAGPENQNRDLSRQGGVHSSAQDRWRGNDDSARWSEGRSRWNEGRERGAEFGRDRQFADGRNFGREYGDGDYGRGYYGGQRDVEPGGWDRPFERHPGEYQSEPLRDQSRDQSRSERHPRDQHREYHAWREEQLRRMDDEYDQFRRHRQSEFNSHFDNWRKDKLSGADTARGAYVGQNDKIGATPVEFGGQNATNSGFTRKDDEGRE